MRTLISTAFISYCFLCSASFAQDKNIPEDKLNLIEAYYSQRDYTNVIHTAQLYIKELDATQLNPKIYFYLAESYYAQGQIDAAIDSYTKGLDLNTDVQLDDMFYQGLAFAFMAKGDLLDAEKTLNRIADSERYLLAKALYSMQLKKYTEALKNLDKLLAKYPKTPFLAQALLIKAESLYKMGRINDAASCYQDILLTLTDPKHNDTIDTARYGLAWCYLKNGEFKKANEEFQKTIQLTTNPIVALSSRIQIADGYFDAKEYRQALSLYEEAKKMDVGGAYADYIDLKRAIIFLKTNHPQDAINVLQRMSKDYPLSTLIPQSKYYLAMAFFSLDNITEARMYLDDLIKRFPDDPLIPKASYLYAQTLIQEKNYAKALITLKEILKKFKEPELKELIYFDIGKLYEERNTFEEAERYYKQCINEYPHSKLSQKARLYLARIYTQKGDIAQAYTLYDELIGLQSEITPEALLDKAYLLKKMKNYEEAILLFKRILDSGADTASVHFTLATCYERLDKLKDALDEYMKVINDSSNNEHKVRAYFRVARIYEKQQRTEAAKKMYQTIVSLNIAESKIAKEKLSDLEAP